MNYFQACIYSFRKHLAQGFLAENCPQICGDVLKLCDEYERLEKENKELRESNKVLKLKVGDLTEEVRRLECELQTEDY